MPRVICHSDCCRALHIMPVFYPWDFCALSKAAEEQKDEILVWAGKSNLISFLLYFVIFFKKDVDQKCLHWFSSAKWPGHSQSALLVGHRSYFLHVKTPFSAPRFFIFIYLHLCFLLDSRAGWKFTSICNLRYIWKYCGANSSGRGDLLIFLLELRQFFCRIMRTMCFACWRKLATFHVTHLSCFQHW